MPHALSLMTQLPRGDERIRARTVVAVKPDGGDRCGRDLHLGRLCNARRVRLVQRAGRLGVDIGGREGPEFLAHQATLLDPDRRLVLGANTFREFAKLWDPPRSPISTRSTRG